jgi:uncharacterized protein YdhG (YjbR/CyaY superfamily)
MSTQDTSKKPKTAKTASGLSAEERAAMKETLRERKAAAKGADLEKECLDRIAEMPTADRSIAERIHKIVKDAAPKLAAKTWYGMPAYAKNDQVICFFQSAAKFKARYATLGFAPPAKLDEGNMWPTYFALTKLTKAEEDKIAALIKKAVG